MAEERGVSLLSSPVRRRIVDHLAQLPWAVDDAVGEGATRREGMTAAELGELLGLHTTTLRFHLDQLVAGGLVESAFVKADGVGRPRKKYFAAEGRLDPVGSAGPYQVLAELLACALDPADRVGTTPEQAGMEWARRRAGEAAADLPAATTPGTWIGKVGSLIDLLADWGYSPQLSSTSDGRAVDVTLRDCPFLELARTHPAVVCGVHRGLLRGALHSVGETDVDVSLQPFVDERTCAATLSSRVPFTPRGATP
ncbi:helix-turn-helix transcriptional regulator [Ornithinimicrobium sediminis]|uniref:helix-turn-helix transcriptional regulator n=1 Tax=Ornithinimicrobium sediminis TaxID=2904603 RepID=UPI001E32EE03|nr:helix-turn-helix domain-containing protein [Ornithinimicrobium sediminis]MCE0487131.1 helix-turn-helix domain-containing protein [Ornithinimicrobium sediminis]